MSLIDQPWTRVRNPVPIPEKLNAEILAALSDTDFAGLVRSNLNPADPSKAARNAWNRLWETLRADDDLADRTYDILEDFQDLTEDALAGDELDEPGRKRAEKFLRACQLSWQRIDREPPAGPLGWAGAAGKFPAPADRVIATMISAIARHRSAVATSPAGASTDDEELWAVLRKINLDPNDYPTRPSSR